MGAKSWEPSYRAPKIPPCNQRNKDHPPPIVCTKINKMNHSFVIILPWVPTDHSKFLEQRKSLPRLIKQWAFIEGNSQRLFQEGYNTIQRNVSNFMSKSKVWWFVYQVEKPKKAQVVYSSERNCNICVILLQNNMVGTEIIWVFIYYFFYDTDDPLNYKNIFSGEGLAQARGRLGP